MKPIDSLVQLVRAKVKSSGLSDSDAKRLQLKGLSPVEVARLVPNPTARPALRIPYFDETGRLTKFFRLRYLGGPSGFDALVAAKLRRFDQASGTLNEVYLPPLGEKPWRVVLSDPSIPIVITEGELKAACATAHGIPTIGLGGVYVWRSAKRELPLLPQLERVKWAARSVFVVFDSDAITNPDITRAQLHLARILLERGAKPLIASIPAPTGPCKQGLDDFVVAHGIDALRGVMRNARPLAEGAALWTMNEEAVFVRNPGLIMVQRTKQKMSPDAFVRFQYADRKHEVVVAVGGEGERPKTKTVGTAKAWIEWSHRFTVEKLTYAPGQPTITSDDCFNSWLGLGVVPKEGSVGAWHKLLGRLFDGAEPGAKEWFEQWCAYPLRHLGTKLFSAVAIWSVVQGVGKSLVGEILAEIYGSNAIVIGDQHLRSQFNGWAENKQLVIGEEITGTDKRADADKLKSLITQTSNYINQKFVPAYVVPDCVNYFFTSNQPDAFFLDDTDRRFFVHEVTGQPESAAFYREVTEWRANGGASHLLHYFLHEVDLSAFDPRAHAPTTAAKRSMIYDGKSDVARWVADLKSDPAQVLKLGELVLDKDLFTSAELLEVYDRAGSKRVTSNGLGRELTKAGFVRLPKTATKHGSQTFYAVRNAQKWLRRKPTECAAHWEGGLSSTARRS